MSNALQITHGTNDTPLKIGDIELPCYVLEGGIRVLTQRGMQTGIGMSTSGGSGGAHRLAKFVEALAEKGIDCNDLALRIRNPIKFSPKGSSGRTAYGYEATILADICDVVLSARKNGVLLPQQSHFAEQCEILVRGFARIGIIALVDEVTGYQDTREKQALQKILDKFLQDEKRKWSKTFPDDFWFKLVKIKGHDSYIAMKRPAFVGHWVNDIIYDRLAPGIKAKLKELNPRLVTGNRKNKHHQHFTKDHGLPELKDHLNKVMVLMDASSNKKEFERLLNRSLPKYGDTIELELD